MRNIHLPTDRRYGERHPCGAPCRFISLSTSEFCGDPNDAVFWISSEAELRAGSWGGSKDGAANRLVARSVKRGVRRQHIERLCQSQRFDDSLQRLQMRPAAEDLPLKAIRLAFADRGA